MFPIESCIIGFYFIWKKRKYTWKNTSSFLCMHSAQLEKISGHNLKIPSPNQYVEFFVKNELLVEMRILLLFGDSQRRFYIKETGCHFQSCDSTGIAVRFIVCSGTFLSCRAARIFLRIVFKDGKLTATVPAILPSSVANIWQLGSFVFSALCLISALTFASSQRNPNGACVC